jgi:photosystem II stability/assembly factor-like uncharacterized protein
MKKYYLILIIFLSLSSQLLPQDWFWQNPLPSGNHYGSVFFISDQVGWIAGGDAQIGILFKTTDGGITWFQQYINWTGEINKIHFVNADVGWICGQTSIILKSTNGGETWIEQETGLTGGIPMAIYFNNTNEGIIVATDNIILKTTDGGDTWLNYFYPMTGAFLKSTNFLDQNIFWLHGWDYSNLVNVIVKTYDGGNSWTTYTNNLSRYYSIYFVTHNLGWSTGGGINKTTDGGNSWTNISNTGISFILFSNPAVGWGMGSDHTIIKTTDGGNTWDLKYEDPNGAYLLSSFIINENNIITVGANGIIIKSTDAGEEWSTLSSGVFPNNYYSIYFINSKLGWIAGSRYAGTNALFKTTDGGENWIGVNVGVGLKSVFFIDSLSGCAAGNGKIIKSTDGGESWDIKFASSEPYLRLEDIYFLTPEIGWCAGRDMYSTHGYIYKTSDGGESWSIFGSVANTYLNEIEFVDELNGFIVCSNGKIVRTTNGGTNWFLQVSGTDEALRSITFVDSITGYIAGHKNTILKTTDKGDSWLQQYVEPVHVNDDFYSISFGDSIYGWVSGNSGALYKTTDGGSNWYWQKNITGKHLWSIFFIDASTGWASGDKGTILKTTQGNIVSIEERSNQVSSEFLISQNYPNPFNPTTTISYSIPELSFVTVKAYDVLGSEITTLVNEEKAIGSYEVVFDAIDLPSGIYFYRLQAGSFVETKKMVHLR